MLSLSRPSSAQRMVRSVRKKRDSCRMVRYRRKLSELHSSSALAGMTGALGVLGTCCCVRAGPVLRLVVGHRRWDHKADAAVRPGDALLVWQEDCGRQVLRPNLRWQGPGAAATPRAHACPLVRSVRRHKRDSSHMVLDRRKICELHSSSALGGLTEQHTMLACYCQCRCLR